MSCLLSCAYPAAAANISAPNKIDFFILSQTLSMSRDARLDSPQDFACAVAG